MNRDCKLCFYDVFSLQHFTWVKSQEENIFRIGKHNNQGKMNGTSMQTMETEIDAYRADDSLYHSPVWIWYARLSEDMCSCMLCNTSVPNTSHSTTPMINHLKRYHGSNQSYNAWTICEELLELRKLRMQTRKRTKLKYNGILYDNENKTEKALQESRGGIQSPGIMHLKTK